MDKTVMIYIEKDNSYLLLYRNKKKNDINQGKYIGIGGHIEEGETPEEALVREVKEETGLTLDQYELRGKLFFYNNDYEEMIYLYTGSATGELIECDEGELHYIPIRDIHNYPLWEGDYVFLDLLAKNSPYFELDLIYEDDRFISYKLY